MHVIADTETGEFIDNPTEAQLAELINGLGQASGTFITLNPRPAPGPPARCHRRSPLPVHPAGQAASPHPEAQLCHDTAARRRRHAALAAVIGPQAGLDTSTTVAWLREFVSAG